MENKDYVSGLFREIEEEVQADKYKELWAKYGTMIISVVGGVLILAALYAYMQNRRVNTNMAYTEDLVHVIQQASKDETAGVGLIETLAKDYSLDTAYIASFYQATIYLENKNETAADQIYQNLMNSGKLPQLYRDYARLLHGYLALDMMHRQADPKMTPEANLADLKPLLKKDNAWYYAAVELQILNLLAQNKTAEAQQIITDILASLDDEDVHIPQGIVQRLEILKKTTDSHLG